LSVDLESLFKSIKEHIGAPSIIFGAGSSDNFHLDKTYQYYQNQHMSRGAAGIFFSGALAHVGISCQHGWKPLGKPRNIDDANGKVVKTISDKKALDILHSSDLVPREIQGDNHIAKISIVGVGMRSHAGIASTMFKALADEGINIQMISTSEIKISVVVHEKYLELGVRALHTAFNLDT